MTDKSPEESGIDLSLLEHICPLRQVPAKQAANSTLAEVLRVFSHESVQHPNDRDAAHVFDQVLHIRSELPIQEHYTDTLCCSTDS